MSSTTRFLEVEVSTQTRACIDRLMAHYCSSIDNGDLDCWPGFFADDCTYRILTRADFEAAAIRHSDIEEHEIGSELADELQHFASLAGFADNHYAFDLFDESPNTSAYQRMIVRD